MKHFLLFFALVSLFVSGAMAQTEMLTGGNLEDAASWQVTLLNTGAGKEPVAVWNSTAETLSAGLNGNLHVSGTTNDGNSQYCIYQSLTLSDDKVYTFDGAFKAIAINNSWCEVFIGTQPTDGDDYGDGQTRLAAFGTWAGYSKDDGIFSADIDAANYATYTPPSSGEYFFVIKMGSTSWDGSDQAFEIVVDEISLMEKAASKIVGGGLLVGGNMEDVSTWQTSLLNTGAGKEPTAVWNNTADAPNSGTGGNLHVSGTTNDGNSQYCIYQSVNLSADSVYTFDGAFKAIAINNSWCEVFIGTQPTDGNDYGEGQTRLAAFGTWAGYNQADGIFSANIDAGNYKVFSPDTTGEYFFVIKMGSTSWDGSDQAFDIIVDELSLVASRTAPIPDFTADILNGIAPVEVNFKNKSKMATSWSWDFGDGSELSTDENPTHTFSEAGAYTITLISTNEIGDSTITKNEFIKVNPSAKLTAGGVLVGGELDDESKWQTTFLATPEGSEPTVTWNDTEHTPAAGNAGALYVTGVSNNSTVQYAIYQKVTLSKDSVYTFNGAVKDFTENLNQAWYEAFIGPEPIDGTDYSKDDASNFLLADFSTWNGDCTPTGIDGTFELNACTNRSFIPAESGDYYFVIKFGTTSWAGDNMPFSLALDELSLVGKRVKPYTKFSSDNPLGFAPLTVNFSDESNFATSWSWNFGDGSAASTEQNPEHVFANVGSYTVTLTATNEKGDSVLVKTDYIKANEKPELPEGEKLYGGNMEDPNLWNISGLNGVAVTTSVWNNREDTLAYGEGGNLMLSALALNNQSMYCIWQAVELTAGMKYTFDGAFRDLSDNLDHFWSEVFIGTTPPVDGADYGEGQTKIAFFNSWTSQTGKGINGTYLMDGGRDNDETVGVFIPDSTATYYFAIKTGVIDWENNEFAFKVLIDELTLQESVNVPAPEADFFADVTEGDSPLTVYFTDLSSNATAWKWHFGDDNTSEEQSPSHIYTTSGTYTVTLIAYNEGQTDTLVVSDLIVVSPGTGIDQMGDSEFKVYPNPSTGVVHITLNGIEEQNISVFDITGKTVGFSKVSYNQELLTIEIEKEGIYLIKLVKEDESIMRKVIVQK